MFDVIIHNTGWPGINLKLSTLEVAVADMHRALEKATELVYEHTKAWMDSQGDGTWDPLADSTVRDKERRGLADPTRPLYATGDLLESATGPYGPHSVKHVGARQAVVGIDWSENGWQIPVVLEDGNERLPPRPILHVDDQLRAEIAGLIEVHVFAPAKVAA